jgi:hypothetical protein
MPSWKELERFLKHDGWEYRPKNSGRDKTYTKMLPSGEILWSRVSKGSGQIGKGLFAAILKHQLKASPEYFNQVLANKKNASNNRGTRD